MKTLLIVTLTAILAAFIGWNASNLFRAVNHTASSSSYAQIAVDLQKALSTKFDQTGTYYNFLSDIPAEQLSFSDGGTPQMLNQFFYKQSKDKKSFILCVYYFDSLKVISGDSGTETFISQPHLK